MGILGLALFILAAIICPFGYWIHTAWYFVALALTLVGGFLFTYSRTQRVSRVEPLTDHLEMPCATRDIRGFPGSKIAAEHHVDFGIDGDAD
jgi:uncharacterized protein (DUF58 family)